MDGFKYKKYFRFKTEEEYNKRVIEIAKKYIVFGFENDDDMLGITIWYN